MKIKQLLFSILFIIGIVNIALSSHIVGGEMTYTYNGADPNQAGNHLYTITMNIYRDCFGGQANFDSTPGLPTGLLSVYEGDTEIETVALDAPDIVTIDAGIDVPCYTLNSSDVCVEQGTYTFLISIPLSTESYYIVYQRCCRSATISNLEEPDINGITIYAEISPESQTLGNSSPYFIAFPPIIACVGMPFSYSLQAADIDGDSLVYHFCAPIKGGSMLNVAPNPDLPPPYTAFNLIAPSTINNPFGLSGPTTLDISNGLLEATPEILGQYVAAVCVEEYRNGVLLSSIQRNILLSFHSCVDPVLTLSITSYPDTINTTAAEGLLEVNPVGGTPPYTYLWDDLGQQTTASIAGLIPGEYSVTVTDANGCEAVITGVVEHVEGTTGINDITPTLECRLYPNPSSDIFYLSWSDHSIRSMYVNCYNLLGENIYTASLNATIDLKEHAIDLSSQPQGIYFITLEDVDRQLVQSWRAIKNK